MNVIQISPAVADHSAVRTDFGQAAYSGLLPRAQWSAAQDLLDRYDRSDRLCDGATCAALASRMIAIGQLVDEQKSGFPALRVAA